MSAPATAAQTIAKRTIEPSSAVKSFQATPAFWPINETLRKLRAKRSTSVPRNHNSNAASRIG